MDGGRAMAMSVHMEIRPEVGRKVAGGAEITSTLLCGDSLTMLQTLPSESVQCCVTSPPYFGLRDYGNDGQIGLEATPDEYITALVAVFREVRRVLKADGTLWLNLGDSYAAGGNGTSERYQEMRGQKTATAQNLPRKVAPAGMKPKDLVGIPWMAAFALRADGWYLRSDIIWAKENPMPESVMDRPTRSHEYLFLLTKSASYYYDHEAIKEPAVSTHGSGNGFVRDERLTMNGRGSEKPWTPGKGGKNSFRGQGHFRESAGGPANREGRDMRDVGAGDTRNKRDVWTVNTKPFPEAHFATFPPDLITPCILAGSREYDTVLDPFNGAATTGVVCKTLQRSYIGIDINPDYIEISRRRLANTQAPLALEFAS